MIPTDAQMGMICRRLGMKQEEVLGILNVVGQGPVETHVSLGEVDDQQCLEAPNVKALLEDFLFALPPVFGPFRDFAPSPPQQLTTMNGFTSLV